MNLLAQTWIPTTMFRKVLKKKPLQLSTRQQLSTLTQATMKVINIISNLEAKAHYEDRYAKQGREDEEEQASILWYQHIGHTSTQETEEQVAQAEQEINAKISRIKDLAK